MESLEPNSFALIARIEQGGIVIPLTRLEQRLRPGVFNTADELQNEVASHDGWKNFSQDGFLGKNESLLEVVSTDLETVRRFETTHAAIAQAIRNILPKWDATTRRDIYPVVNLQPEYEYLRVGEGLGPQPCPWECKASGQKAGIIVRKGLSEDDLWEAKLSEHGNSGYNRLNPEWLARTKAFDVPMSEEEKKISDAYTRQLERIVANKKIKDREVFYAPLTSLLPHLIEEHGFFEGRESPYRADPEFLIRAFGLGTAGS